MIAGEEPASAEAGSNSASSKTSRVVMNPHPE